MKAKSISKLIPLLLIPLCCLFCEREDPDGGDKDAPLVFTSLQVGRDTIFTEDTTLIRATASGYKITYHWEVEKGDLLGSGPQITFLATPCTVGKNTVFCTVRDGNSKEITKQVEIIVF
jgi:hypothetical protein